MQSLAGCQLDGEVPRNSHMTIPHTHTHHTATHTGAAGQRRRAASTTARGQGDAWGAGQLSGRHAGDAVTQKQRGTRKPRDTMLRHGLSIEEGKLGAREGRASRLRRLQSGTMDFVRETDG